MIARGRRAAAFGVDAALALVATGVLALPILSFADPEVWQIFNPVPLTWALVMIVLSLLNVGTTPGKRWTGLVVTGGGCLICREIRRIGWALVLGLQQLAFSVLTRETNLALQLIALALLLWLILKPILTRAEDFPHNLQTGFRVRMARAV